MLEIQLLGHFRVTYASRLIEIPSRPAQSLLAYLVLNPGKHHRREKLAGLIWPEASETNARSYLRMALWRLHKSFQEASAQWKDFIQADEISVCFQRPPEYRLDVDLVLDTYQLASRSISELSAYAAAHSGELLPGFYEEWIMLARERVQSCFEQKIYLLVERLVDSQNWDEVLTWAERWISFGSLPEPAYKAILIAQFMRDNLPGVKVVYERYRDTLEKELGLPPSPEFEQLYHSILSGTYSTDPITFTRPDGTEPLEQPSVPGDPPFKGLEFFDFGDQDLFFGRERQVSALLEYLQRNNFLAVVGASGSGKSSIVRAGLAPALAQNTAVGWPGDIHWLVKIITPTSQPLDVLASCLGTEMLPQDQSGLLDKMREWVDHRGADKVLLIVDQFEELFTLCRDELTRTKFVEILLAMADLQGDDFLKLVITLRADFYVHCAAYPRLAKLLAQHQEFVSPMSEDELRRAIEEPARRGGWRVEPGLVDLLLRDAKEEPGSLPLLSHALLETWRRRRGRALTLRGYAETGRVQGAIAKTAERVFYQDLSTEQQLWARQIFLRLTELGEGTQDTRRRVEISELLPGPEQARAVQDILDVLAASRLVTISQDCVEVSHEALIREWPALRQWLTEDRESLRLHRRLTEASKDWEAMDKDEGELFSGARLAQVTEWAGLHTNNLNPLEREFIDASLALANRKSAEREEQQQREIESARKLAELERSRAELQMKTTSRLRIRAYLLTGLMAMVVALGALAFSAWRQSAREAAIHHSLALAASAQQANEAGRTDLALALALEAVNLDAPPVEAVQALRQIAMSPGTRSVLIGHSASVLTAAISPDQATALSGSCTKLDQQGECQKGEVILWDLSTGAERKRWTIQDDWIRSIAYSANGRAGISGSADGSILCWDLETGERNWHASGHSGPITSLEVDPNGRFVLSSSEDGSIALWDLQTGALKQRFAGDGQAVSKAVFSPDGSQVISGGQDGVIKEWDPKNGQLSRNFSATGWPIRQLDVSPAISQTVAIYEDLYLRLWDNQTGEVIKEQSIGCKPLELAQNPDGTFALISCEALFLRWDLQKWRETQQFVGHTEPINSLSVSSDGRIGLSASDDGTLRVWNLSTQVEHISFTSGEPGISDLVISSDGKSMLLGAEKVVLWSMADQQVIRRFEGFEGYISPGAVDVSPNGAFVAAAGGLWPPKDIRSLVMWNVETGEITCSFSGHNTMLRSVAFSPDNRYLLAGSQNPVSQTGDLILWDVQNCALVRRFETSEDVTALAFSQDGKKALSGTGFSSAIKLWEVETGKMAKRFQIPEPGPVLDLAFGPGEKTVLGAGIDRLILWDLISGEIIRIYSGHTGMPWSLDISPDGETIISGSHQGEVILWEFSTGEILYHGTLHSSPVYSVIFSPDGRYAYSASDDGKIIQWRIREQTLPELLAWTAANRFHRLLTCDERQQYRVLPLCDSR